MLSEGSRPVAQPAHWHRAEERFRLLVESVKDYAIFMLDPNGIVASWNEGAYRIKGYTANEIIGAHFSRFYPPADIAAGQTASVRSKRRSRIGRVEDEGLAGTEGWHAILGGRGDLRRCTIR